MGIEFSATWSVGLPGAIIPLAAMISAGRCNVKGDATQPNVNYLLKKMVRGG